MYGGSKKSSKRIDRPFSADLLKRAREIAKDYQIVLSAEDGEYYGRGLELPNVMGDGKTPDECVKTTREALVTAVAYLLEKNETPPAPANENKRTEQVNIRLTAEEKLRLEDAARRKGFRGISDLIRTTSLATIET